ncbi:MAG: hypothetical protein ABIS06_11895 [Vicinamibacterales bacterium]
MEKALVHQLLRAVGLQSSPPVLRVLLPVGISFYTFQAMSYTIDVYRGELRARRSLIDVAAFISFFPHLVAGPIQRASFLLPQVEGRRRFSIDAARTGFLKIFWGFFKKLVIADNVGVIANKVFVLADPSFPILWAGVFAFAVQIYADFSPYTDIARGVSRWLGFELTENCNHPYLATALRISGGGGIFRCQRGFEITSTCRLAGRARGVALGAQPHGDVPALRFVARRQLELCSVGALP